MQKMSGSLRPNLSERAPKNTAPSGRIASVKVSVFTTDAFDTWKWSASVSNRNTMTKKSNASSTQPRIAEATAGFQPLDSCSTAASIPVESAMYHFRGPSPSVDADSTACDVQLYPVVKPGPKQG